MNRRAGVRPDLVGDLGQRLGISCIEDDLRTGLREALGEGPSDPAGLASDQRGAPGDVEEGVDHIRSAAAEEGVPASGASWIWIRSRPLVSGVMKVVATVMSPNTKV